MSDAKPYTEKELESHLSLYTSPAKARTIATVRALDAANARVAELEFRLEVAKSRDLGSDALLAEENARVAELEAKLEGLRRDET